MSTVVLGLGNLLLGDEGVGVHAARALLEDVQEEDLHVLEVGTALLDALPCLKTAQRIIILDAMKAGGDPGSVYRMVWDAPKEGPSVVTSLHGFDIFHVLRLAEREDVPEVIVYGVEPHLIDWSLELSAPVARAVPDLVKEVRKDIAGASLAPESPGISEDSR